VEAERERDAHRVGVLERGGHLGAPDVGRRKQVVIRPARELCHGAIGGIVTARDEDARRHPPRELARDARPRDRGRVHVRAHRLGQSRLHHVRQRREPPAVEDEAFGDHEERHPRPHEGRDVLDRERNASRADTERDRVRLAGGVGKLLEPMRTDRARQLDTELRVHAVVRHSVDDFDVEMRPDEPHFVAAVCERHRERAAHHAGSEDHDHCHGGALSLTDAW